jgi:preprotein translocase subunit SecE
VAETTEQRAEGGGSANSITTLVPRTIEFLKESWQELKRVHWPSVRETYSATLIVIAVVLAVSLFLGVVDFLLSWLMSHLLGRA